ncbi:TPM domain-containing protein [Pacificimonas flava]|uniref:TPM domain-containing protein n=1 Tax=Pacificimonas flava TaxID=1234595 RepID=M2SF91_9SPHN|nr:TPM domain-containing protein [Pacificimonas flava]EMD84030.1 Hypothetical protein C725_1002 [Pacificimonas flava]MBB5280998.1 putative membrane protein [Pacificimonas flava]
MALTSEEHSRISAAIRETETRTSGEILCVFTEAADDMRIVPLAYAGVAALVLPPLLLFFGFVDPSWFLGWRAVSDIPVRVVTSVHAGLSVLIFLAAWLIARPLRFRLAPRSLRAANVDRAATEAFLAQGLQTTDDRTGILIFLSRCDHIAEILADEGIHRLVGEDAWADIIEQMLARAREGRIAEAFLDAIAACGNVLAEHFPPGEHNPNELPDRLIEL